MRWGGKREGLWIAPIRLRDQNLIGGLRGWGQLDWGQLR
jgi:hypothetical protein